MLGRFINNVATRATTSLTTGRKVITLLSSRNLTANVIDNGDYIIVTKNQTKPEALSIMKFPSIWLRDNCRCSECFHSSSQSRQIDWDRFDFDVRPIEVKTDTANRQVAIQWSDGHQSKFDLDWLNEREFTEERRQKYLKSDYRPQTIHWSGTEIDKIMPKFEYGAVMAEDEALKSWLEALAVYGVALLKHTPLEAPVVRILADRVGFLRRTTYGEEFIVQAKPDAKNYAYLSSALPLHTDLPYYEYKPSVNILHCMVQSKSHGGSNLLVDGHHIADRLKAERPEDYQILTRTLVDWNDIGSDDGRSFHNIWRAPVICLDSDGNYSRINHSIPQRDSHFSVPLSEVRPWYAAYSRFVRMARNDAYAFKTVPGDVLTFNNIRLLHGRTAYDDTDENVRFICGAYLDWDIIYSRWRVLKAASVGRSMAATAATAASQRESQ